VKIHECLNIQIFAFLGMGVFGLHPFLVFGHHVAVSHEPVSQSVHALEAHPDRNRAHAPPFGHASTVRSKDVSRRYDEKSSGYARAIDGSTSWRHRRSSSEGDAATLEPRRHFAESQHSHQAPQAARQWQQQGKEKQRYKKGEQRPDNGKFAEKANSPHQMKLARKLASEETLSVLKRGWYVLHQQSGKDQQTTPISTVIEINDKIEQATQNSICYPPEDEICDLPTVSGDSLMMVEVVDDLTLNCCKRLWKEVRYRRN
jgi:hypothetical protein